MLFCFTYICSSMGISFVERMKLSCFTYIYLERWRELVIHMVRHKILHKLVDRWIWYVWFLAIVLWYKGGSMWVVLVSNYGLVRTLALRFVIPEACTYSPSLCYEVGAWFIIECPPYEWRSGTSDDLCLPIYLPRGMRSSTLLRGLIKFCNKYMSSLWLMLSPWIIRTLTLPSLLASTVPCIALFHLESWCKLRRCIQTPWYDMLYHT